MDFATSSSSSSSSSTITNAAMEYANLYTKNYKVEPMDAMTLLSSATKESSNSVDPITVLLLTWISTYLDEHGANEWNLRHVAIVSAVVLLLIKMTLHKRGGIDWYALLHSVVSALGALSCCYLSEYSSLELTGIPEPLRSLQCYGPLTSLHRIIPSITMGYAFIDCIDGLYMNKIDFIIHGVATFAVMIYFIEMTMAPEVIAPMLILECSTVFLNLLGIANYLPNLLSIGIILSFVVAFFIFRICVFPYIHMKLMYTLYEQLYVDKNTDYTNCYPESFIYVCAMFGVLFHCLNSFWMYKILCKLHRKVVGYEKFTHENSCDNYNNYQQEEREQQQQQQQQKKEK